MVPSRPRSPLRPLLLAACCCTFLTGCVTSRDPTTTGSIGRQQTVSVEQQAQALRAAGKPGEAVNLLRAALTRNPKSKPLLAAYGRALADAGRTEEALAALASAQDPRHPDWRILNTEGALLDRLGRTIDAQGRYRAALKIKPEEPSVLSNLGLSLALSDKPAEAEAVLRKAAENPAATPKIRQNLALVLALQGKYEEAEQLARRDLPAEEVAANMRYWKSMRAKPAATPAAKMAPGSPAKDVPPAAAADGLGLRG